MKDRKTLLLADTPWERLNTPENYPQMTRAEKQGFLATGVNILAAKMGSLDLVLTGNVAALRDLIIGERDELNVQQLESASIGFDYAGNMFRSSDSAFTDQERASVLGFLGEVDTFLTEKFPPKE